MAANTSGDAAKETTLPDTLDISNASTFAGPDKAEAFLHEVMFAGWGNLTEHSDIHLDIKGLVDAANDPNNSQKTLAKTSLAKVQAVFKRYQK